MSEATWQAFDDVASFADATARALVASARQGIIARGEALLAVPGGSTPRPVFECLRAAGAGLDWSRVTVVPTDERIVPRKDPLSNAALIERAFAPLGARVIALVRGDERDSRVAGQAADARLQAVPWPPELVWLGVGEDGHTASIFAGPDLQAALEAPATCRALGVRPDPLPPEAPVARVTLSRAAILAARSILLAVRGAAKQAVLARALSEGAESLLPVGRVLAGAAGPIRIHWLST